MPGLIGYWDPDRSLPEGLLEQMAEAITGPSCCDVPGEGSVRWITKHSLGVAACNPAERGATSPFEVKFKGRAATRLPRTRSLRRTRYSVEPRAAVRSHRHAAISELPFSTKPASR